MVSDKGETVTVVTDSYLLSQFREGDESSFTELFGRHYDMIYGVLYRLTGTRQHAEDLAQEVFIKLYKRPLRHSDNVAGWLYRVAVNTGYNALRSENRRSRNEKSAGQSMESPDKTEVIAARRETQRQVRIALSKIPPRSAKMLILRQTGFSYKEVADIIGVSPGSVGTLLARAQKAFRSAYGEEE